MAVFVFPGQGSQNVGMGQNLWDKFPDIIKQADEILGYSITELCLNDLNGNLNNTAYTQPALYTVNALHYFDYCQQNPSVKPNYVLGHSLGEYNALLAANVFDFATGLRLVQKRGELMAKATGGKMAAVLNMPSNVILENVLNHGITTVDIANFNTHKQTVISGLEDSIEQAKEILTKQGARVIVLKVSGAFHSRYMISAANEFANFLNNIDFYEPQHRVIANVTAKNIMQNEIKDSLMKQIYHPVRWVESINHLLAQGEDEFIEMGPGNVLTNMIAAIKNEYHKNT
jgi:malonyl CoA-acyl carrier protein transacylase